MDTILLQSGYLTLRLDDHGYSVALHDYTMFSVPGLHEAVELFGKLRLRLELENQGAWDEISR